MTAQPQISEAQIAANRENSRTSGLFTAHPFIRPEEQREYALHLADFESTLAPATILESTYACEIAGASWRLRRCNMVEAESIPDEAGQQSIDRARAAAHNVIRKATAELRRLQTERQVRNEIFPEGTDLSDLGLASMKEVIAVRNNFERSRLAAERVGNFDAPMSVIHKACSPPPRAAAPVPAAAPDSFCKTPAAPDSSCKTPAAVPAAAPDSFCKKPARVPVLGRNTPCPCKSGLKYKRCCGANAPAILYKAA